MLEVVTCVPDFLAIETPYHGAKRSWSMLMQPLATNCPCYRNPPESLARLVLGVVVMSGMSVRPCDGGGDALMTVLEVEACEFLTCR